MVLLFYTTRSSVDLPQYEIFGAKVCIFWQGCHNHNLKESYLVFLLNHTRNAGNDLAMKRFKFGLHIKSWSSDHNHTFFVFDLVLP